MSENNLSGFLLLAPWAHAGRDALGVASWFPLLFPIKGFNRWHRNCNNMAGFTVLQKYVSNSQVKFEESLKKGRGDKSPPENESRGSGGGFQNHLEDRKSHLWAKNVSGWAGDWSWSMTIIPCTYCKSCLCFWLRPTAALSSILVINTEWNDFLYCEKIASAANPSSVQRFCQLLVLICTFTTKTVESVYTCTATAFCLWLIYQVTAVRPRERDIYFFKWYIWEI